MHEFEHEKSCSESEQSAWLAPCIRAWLWPPVHGLWPLKSCLCKGAITMSWIFRHRFITMQNHKYKIKTEIATIG
jgi:hypothetical protein